MKKMKSLMLLVATMLLLAVVFCMNASAAEWLDLGENHQYTFDKETGVMVVKGEGEISSALFGIDCPEHYKGGYCNCNPDITGAFMDDYIEWKYPERLEAYRAAVKTKTLIVQEGTTALAPSAFYIFSSLEVAILPQSLTEISAGAFYQLSKLNTVVLSNSVTTIGESAFDCCFNLRNIYLPETIKTIAKDAFSGCDKNNIKLPASIKNVDELGFFGGKTELKVKNREGNKVYLEATVTRKGAQKFEYYRYDNTTKKYTFIEEKSSRVILLDNLEPGKTYYFVAKAYRENDVGKLYCEKSDLLTVVMPPEKPEKVTATQTDSSITLSWSKSPTATGYRIYYRSDLTFPTFDTIVVSSTKSTSHTFTGLEPGKRYNYAVRPYVITAEGEVLWGQYTGIDAYTAPSTVTAKATSSSKGKINLTWNNVDGDIDGYRVYYKVGNGAYKIYKNYGSAQNLTFSNLKSGTKYTFAVRAGIKTSGGIVWSGYKTATVTVK